MHTLRPLAMALGLSSMLLSANAVADALATAELRNIRLTLIDLDPTDPFGPSVSFASNLPPSDTASVDSRIYIYDSFTLDLRDQTSLNQFGQEGRVFSNVSLENLLGGATIKAGVTHGADAMGDHNLLASGQARPSSGTLLSFNASALGAVNHGTDFVLSPHTLLVLTGEAVLDLTTTFEQDPWSFKSDGVNAMASMTLKGVGSSGLLGSSQIAEDSASLAFAGEGAQRSQLKRTLSVSFLNNSSNLIAGSLKTEAYVSGFSNAGLVPEPQTWALALVGLCTAAGVASARQKRAG